MIQSISGVLFFFLMAGAGIEIRKQGCVTFFHFVRWEDIDSYEWTPPFFDPKHYLTLQIKRRDSPLPLTQNVRTNQKETVDGILRAHLPQAAPGVPTRDAG